MSLRPDAKTLYERSSYTGDALVDLFAPGLDAIQNENGDIDLQLVIDADGSCALRIGENDKWREFPLFAATEAADDELFCREFHARVTATIEKFREED